MNDGVDYSIAYGEELDEEDVEEDDDVLNQDLPFCGGSIISPRLTTGLGKHAHSRKLLPN